MHADRAADRPGRRRPGTVPISQHKDRAMSDPPGAPGRTRRRPERPRFQVEPLEGWQLLAVYFRDAAVSVGGRAGAAVVTLYRETQGPVEAG